MDSLQVFRFEELNVRVVSIEGEAWFVARDVCEALDISDSRQAVERLDGDERCLIPVTDSLGRTQQTFAVNEPGLYGLVLGSRKPEAREFKRWVKHEVLPSIRKTGSYAVTPQLDERQLRTQLFKAALEHEERLGTVEQRIETVERKVEEQITLDSGSQRTLQKAIARRVYDLATDYRTRRELFNQLYKEIKDRWAVPSYKDVRRSELDEVQKYVNAWKPRIA